MFNTVKQSALGEHRRREWRKFGCFWWCSSGNPVGEVVSPVTNTVLRYHEQWSFSLVRVVEIPSKTSSSFRNVVTDQKAILRTFANKKTRAPAWREHLWNNHKDRLASISRAPECLNCSSSHRRKHNSFRFYASAAGAGEENLSNFGDVFLDSFTSKVFVSQ